MKNLQKVLCLVLAMVMMLSVMIVGAGAAKTFPDQKDIQNVEAVNMAVALNIIQGRDTGEFDPTGNITRAEMAKMICVLWNGGKEPNLGTTTEANYTDINGHWAEKYIEYCSALGIVAGMGDNTFNPNGSVTGTQAAKMLLVCLGFDADAEGFNGLNWSTKIDVRANTKSLYADMTSSFTPSGILSRDDAAQMMWNALQAYMVSYDSELQMVDGQLQSVKVLKDKTDINTLGNTFIVTLLYDKYDKADQKEAVLDGFTYDDNKEEWSYSVSYRNSGSGPASFTSEQDFTYLYQQNIKVVYNPKNNNANAVDNFYGMFADESVVLAEGVLGDIDDANDGDKKVTIGDKTYNLDAADSAIPVYFFNAGGSHTLDEVQTWENADAYKFQAIDTKEDNKIDFLVAYPFVVGEVTYAGAKTFNVNAKSEAFVDTNDNGIKDGGESYLLSYTNSLSGVDYDDVTYDNGMKKENFVVFTPAEYSATDDDIFTVIADSDILKGDVSSYKNPSSSLPQIRVDSTWYTMLTDAASQISGAGGTVKKAPVVNGYAFVADATASLSVSDYAVVIGYGAAGGLDGARVKLLRSDGSKTIVDVDVDCYYDDNNSNGSYDAGEAKIAGMNTLDLYLANLDTNKTLVTFEVNSDDEYDLSLAPTTTSASGYDNVDLAPTFTANSSGKVKYLGGDNIADDAVILMEDGTSFKVITGARLKTLTAAGLTCDIAYSNDSTSGYGTVELAYVRSSTSAVSADVSYGFVTDMWSTTSNVKTFEIWTPEGKAETYETKASLSTTGVQSGSVISYTLNEDGKIDTIKNITVTGQVGNSTAITAWDGDTYMNVDAYYSSNTKTWAGSKSRAEFTDDTVVILINAEKTEGVAGGKGDIVIADEPSAGTFDKNAVVVLNSADEIELVVLDIKNDIDDIH